MHTYTNQSMIKFNYSSVLQALITSLYPSLHPSPPPSLHPLPYFFQPLSARSSACLCVCACDERGLGWFPSVPSKTTTQRLHYVAEWMEERGREREIKEKEERSLEMKQKSGNSGKRKKKSLNAYCYSAIHVWDVFVWFNCSAM